MRAAGLLPGVMEMLKEGKPYVIMCHSSATPSSSTLGVYNPLNLLVTMIPR